MYSLRLLQTFKMSCKYQQILPHLTYAIVCNNQKFTNISSIHSSLNFSTSIKLFGEFHQLCILMFNIIHSNCKLIPELSLERI